MELSFWKIRLIFNISHGINTFSRPRTEKLKASGLFSVYVHILSYLKMVRVTAMRYWFLLNLATTANMAQAEQTYLWSLLYLLIGIAVLLFMIFLIRCAYESVS